MSSLNKDDLLKFANCITCKLASAFLKILNKISSPYEKYDINVTASHHSNDEKPAEFIRSYTGNFKINISDVLCVAFFATAVLSFLKSVKNFFK